MYLVVTIELHSFYRGASVDGFLYNSILLRADNVDEDHETNNLPEAAGGFGEGK
jgi:hypothetical protein